MRKDARKEVYMEQRRRKSNRMWVILGILVILAGAVGFIGYRSYQASQQKKQGEETIQTFVKALKKGNYSKISNYLSTESVQQTSFTKKEINEKYQAIFDGISASDIKVSNISVTGDQFSYELSFSTGLGSLKNKYSGTFASNNQKINWKPNLIFPGMSGKDTISYTAETAVRGEILDRNGDPLAENGTIYSLGVAPVKLGSGTTKATNISEIASYTGLTEDDINTALKQSWVTDDTFVPLKTVTEMPSDLPETLDYKEESGRKYPLAEAAAQLIGYVGEVTADDLKKDDTLSSTSTIGRAGLERTYDKKLRGQDGGILVINDSKGNQKKVLQKVKKKDGSDVKLTIDSEAQQIAYDALGENPGSSVATTPKTGELLVLASSPSYDPNLMSHGISQTEYDVYNNNTDLPFTSRFTTRYAPGSTFKLVTAAIGLDADTLNPDEEVAISGLKWQEDSSWGDYQVTRVHDVSPVNLETALVYSDNIYMAQQALKMGEKTFRAGLNKFVFGKDLDLPFAMDAAQISNKKSFSSDILLADTGYGQGQLLMSPIQQMATYSVFPNGGTLVYPKILASAETKKKENVISSSAAQTITTDMQAVVSDENGTAHSLASLNISLAAKTGTAEIKETQDTTGQENSFLYAFDPDNQGYAVLNFLEDVSSDQSARGISGDLLTYLHENYQ